ncbi:N-acetylmuramoyl-L-alanine amidase [Paenisporosarcina macmurdoensis]|uniref:N-acetylmuramoyl-L-alanine amidase n=1 Tax=Paenisporosarcina macmurdoensis TaxID=212659 RepID=A0ABW1L1A5_9BACL
MKKWISLVALILVVSIFVPLKPASANTSFSDVGTTHRAQAEIYYLVQGGIVGGVSSTQFVPDKHVTRGEAAAMIGRALGLNGERLETKFSDVSSSNFASGYIKQMVEKGIISGYPDGTFKPYTTLTRGQMAVLMNRAFNYGANTVSVASSTLMDKGIAQGMSDGTFGQELTIKRGDFAVFLARGVNTKFRTVQTETFEQTMYVNTNDLYFRVGPNTSYPWMLKLQKGQEVKYSYAVGEWSVIKVDDLVGFVHNSYIQLQKPSTTIPTPPTGGTLSDLTVIIDPGHGGTDPGGSGNGFVEKNVVLNVANHMNSYFAKTSIKSYMTRTSDTYITLPFRTEFAARYKGDAFVSLHTNALNGTANGQESFYYAQTASTNPYVKESRALAIYSQNRMQETWNLTNRGVNPFGYGNFHVLRENTMPATLVEMGFIDSPKDITYIKSETERQKMGKALFLATLDYFYHYKGRQDVLPLYKQFGATPSKRLH